MHVVLTGLLLFFAMASFILAIVTISNYLRLRNVMQTWRSGHLGGYPLFATIFMGCSVVLAGTALFYSYGNYYGVSAAYMFLAVNWLVSSYLMSKRYITDHGIVKNINDPSQTISWTSIHDFAELNEDGKTIFKFFYGNELHRNNPPKGYYRLELEVPDAELSAFKKVLNHKLGRRFQYDFTDEPVFRKIDSERL